MDFGLMFQSIEMYVETRDLMDIWNQWSAEKRFQSYILS